MTKYNEVTVSQTSAKEHSRQSNAGGDGDNCELLMNKGRILKYAYDAYNTDAPYLYGTVSY